MRMYAQGQGHLTMDIKFYDKYPLEPGEKRSRNEELQKQMQ